MSDLRVTQNLLRVAIKALEDIRDDALSNSEIMDTSLTPTRNWRSSQVNLRHYNIAVSALRKIEEMLRGQKYSNIEGGE